MKRISADRMYIGKWVAPGIAVVALVAWAIVDGRADDKSQLMVRVAVVAVALAVLGATFRKRMWQLADEVLDGGDYLLVRFGTRQQRLSISNISKVDLQGQLGATTVTLHLLVPGGDFGATVSFLAESQSRNSFAANPIAEDLLARVNDRSSKRVV